MKKPNKKDYNFAFYNNIDLFKYVNDLEKYTDHLEFLQDPISKILKSTTYTVEEITDFIFLTGIEIDKTARILLIFDSCGIPNLNNINTLAKMDMLKLESL
jgi:hypothetical protein